MSARLVKWAPFALGVVGVAVVIGIAATVRPGAQAAPPPLLAWRVERGDFAPVVQATGELRAAVVTPVLSPLSGHALLYLAPEGATLKAGDVIARLDTEELEDSLLDTEGSIASARAALAAAQVSLSKTKAELAANLKELEAQLRVAEAKAALEESKPLPEDRRAAEARAAAADAQAGYATSYLENTQQLFAEGVVSGQDVAEARRADSDARLQRDSAHESLAELLKGAEHAALETARAGREQARLSLQEARDSVDKQTAQAESAVKSAQNQLDALERTKAQTQKDIEAATVRAPHDGVVFSPEGRKTELGDTTSRGEPLRDLADTASVYFAARVRESDSPKVSVGQPVEVTLPADPGHPLSGEVSKVGTALTEDENVPSMRYLEVEVALGEAPAGLRPGLTGKADIRVEGVPGALVVPLAAVRDGAATVLTSHGPVRRPVRLGPDDGTLAVVESGLSEGESVALQEE